MYTVIIQKREEERLGGPNGARMTAREMSRAYRRLFFREAIDRGDVDFCTWNPEGTTVETALPDLYRLIAGKRDWRAIVVLTPTEEEQRQAGELGLDTREQNPFDYLINKDQSAYEISESSVPLIRMTQLLGGVPKPEMRFERVEHEGENGEFFVSFEPQKQAHEAAMEAHKALSQQYLFVDNRPREILLVATRQPVDTSEQETRSAWAVRMESESSEFWSRNRYPSICRFITCDVLNERHSLYPGSIFKLWSAVLLLAVNQLDASSLQAYRLYHLSLEMDQKRLGAAFSGYAAKLRRMSAQLDAADANRESVARQVIRETPELAAEVTVTFTTNRPSALMVDTRPLGLVTDKPQEERQYWRQCYHRATASLNELLSAPARLLDVAADDTRCRGVYPPEEVEILNRYQRSDLEEQLKRSYFKALDARAALGFNVKKRRREREIIDQQVRRRISQRLNAKRAVTAAGVCLGVLAVGSLPYLIGAARVGFGALLWALLALVCMLAVASGFGLAELWIQRREMADAMEDHNRCMYQVEREVQISARHYSDYLSSLCTYLRGRSYLDREQELLHGLANVERLRLGHRRAIQKCLGLVRVWSAALGAVVDTSLAERRDDCFDPAVPPEENLAYRFDLPSGGRHIPLNNTGEYLFAPFDFIQGVTLEREELYDDVDSDRNH